MPATCTPRSRRLVGESLLGQVHHPDYRQAEVRTQVPAAWSDIPMRGSLVIRSPGCRLVGALGERSGRVDSSTGGLGYFTVGLDPAGGDLPGVAVTTGGIAHA
jgi:hypothetical protein